MASARDFLNCCERGDFEEARRQLELGVNPNSCADEDGWTSVHYGVWYGEVDFFKTLIKNYSCSAKAMTTHDIEKNGVLIMGGSTPLHVACLLVAVLLLCVSVPGVLNMQTFGHSFQSTRYVRLPCMAWSFTVTSAGYFLYVKRACFTGSKQLIMLVMRNLF